MNIPFSFVYYFNEIFGLGFSHSFETAFLVHYIYNPNLGFVLTNKFRIVNKIGKNIFKDSLIIEYGINLSTLFDINTSNKTFSYNGIIFGPTFLIGKESIYKKFSYMIGGTIDTLIYGKDDNSAIRSPARRTFLLSLGIEARFRFCFIKEVK